MDFFWLYDLPNWDFGLRTVTVFVIFSVIGLWISRRLVLRFIGTHTHNDLVSFYLAAVGVFYGITLGLIAVSTYTNYSAADNIVSEEAASVAALYRDLSNYPNPDGKPLREQLKKYAEIVINVVWQKQREGANVTEDVEQLRLLNKTMLEFNPANNKEGIIHAEALRQFNELIRLNNLRSQSASVGLPCTMYVVIVVGALLNIMVSWLFIIENARIHYLLNIVMAGLLGLLVFLIAVMDYPYRGEYSIKPDGLQYVLDNYMKE